MANLLLYTDFVGEYNIPNLDSVENQETFTEFIGIWEEFYGCKTLGYELYSKMKTALQGYEPETIYQDLWDGVEYTDSNEYLQKYQGMKKMLLYFLKYQWIRENQTFDLAIGQRQIDSVNTTKVSARGLLCNLWAKGLRIHINTEDFINLANETTPETYDPFEFTVLETLNEFDI